MPGLIDNQHIQSHEKPEYVSPKKMRPGGIGKTVFYILLGSLVLVVLAGIVLELWAYPTP